MLVTTNHTSPWAEMIASCEIKIILVNFNERENLIKGYHLMWGTWGA